MIFIKKNKIDDISLYHELFHMASNATSGKIIKNGFYLNHSNISIGIGLNEGYTEYLSRKYFGKNDNLYYYDFEVVVAKCIEDIIGKNKMESFYLRAQLDSLINELCLYIDYDEVMSFIRNVDFVQCNIYQDDMKEEIISKVKKINEFIINLRLKKYGLAYLESNSLLKVNYESNDIRNFNLIQDDVFIKNIIDNYNKENKIK